MSGLRYPHLPPQLQSEIRRIYARIADVEAGLGVLQTQQSANPALSALLAGGQPGQTLMAQRSQVRFKQTYTFTNMVHIGPNPPANPELQPIWIEVTLP